ncbi:MAG: hypothetical protein ABI690_18245 [Chloroflexota bacterium]
MLRQNPHLLLMGALDFSASDLAANSKGAFSPTQKHGIQQAHFRHIALLVIAAICVWIGGIELNLDWMVMVFGTVVLVSLMLGVYHGLQADLESPVQAIAGRVNIAFLMWGSRVQVNGDTFRASRSVGEAFKPGHIYRLYHTAHSRLILSAELVA